MSVHSAVTTNATTTHRIGVPIKIHSETATEAISQSKNKKKQMT